MDERGNSPSPMGRSMQEGMVGRAVRRDFSWALDTLRDGGSVTRHNWNGPNQRLHLQRPDSGSKMTQPYIFIVTAQGDRVPWFPSQTDLLANDWHEVSLTLEQREGRA